MVTEPASLSRPVFLRVPPSVRCFSDPELALGEAYMDGTFLVERRTIADALAILMDQRYALPSWAKPQWWLRIWGGISSG